MASFFTNTFFLGDSTTVEIETNCVTFKNQLNRIAVMVENDALLEAIANYLSKQDAETLGRFAGEHFIRMFCPALEEISEV